MARTAVIAGTATAVSNKVSAGQAKAQARRQQQAAVQTAAANQAEPGQLRNRMETLQAQQAAAQAGAAPPAATGTILEQWRQLARLKEAVRLTDEQFEAAKNTLLAG